MEQSTILREIVEQAYSLNTLDSASYSACKSKSTYNTKNDRIMEISSSTKKKNKVEDYSRIFKSSLNKTNCVVEPSGNAIVQHSKLNTNSELMCVKYSGCSKHMTGDRSQLTNFVHKFLGTVKFGNDQIEKIMGYGDYQIGNITILRVYYVEGLGHILFYVGQLCDSDLEVAFKKHICYVRNLEGDDLLSGPRETDLYTLSMGDMMESSPICLLSKASKTKSWLWHRRLSHLNFGAINHLAKNCLVQGLPKLKFEKDHLYSACAMGKSKKQSHKPKYEDTNQEKLYLLHMDLCGPMRVASINEKKYILVIMDDYSRFTWMKFLASKYEAPNFIITHLKMIQVRLNTSVRNIRTDNGTEFVNQTLRSYYKSVGISHEKSVARSPQQNGVVERRNHTLVEAARTMSIYAKALLFLWAEAVATACYTQNQSIIQRCHGKTPYELLHDKKPDLSYLHLREANRKDRNPNGTQWRHPSPFPEGEQSKWLTPRVEGNEVRNLEEIASQLSYLFIDIPYLCFVDLRLESRKIAATASRFNRDAVMKENILDNRLARIVTPSSAAGNIIFRNVGVVFPPSKTTNLRNEITRFQQRFDESFYEAWDRFNDLLRACPHHEFSELHQLDTFYNALNVNDQDSLNSAAGGNFLDKMPRASSSTPAVSSEVTELKDLVRALLLDKKNQSSALVSSPTPAPVKAVEPNYVTCGASPAIVEPLRVELPFLEDQFQEDPPPEVSMADNRTMAELLQAPTEGYKDTIFFPPSKTTNLRNEITRFQQRFDESFYEAWERFNDLLRACPHHGFSELHQLDTFYNALNVNDQDSLNSAAGGNLLDKMPRECLKIIESKSKVRQTRTKEVVAKVSTSSSTPAISYDVAELKDMVRALLLDKKNQSSAPASSSTPAPVKAVNQPPAYQALAYQAPISQTQSVSKTDFESYVKANDAVLRNMQNQGQNMQIQMANLTDMLSKFVSSNTASSSGLGTLHSNTITNPKEDLKVQTPSSQSTAPVQPPVAQSETQTLVSEPVIAPVSVLMPNLKSSIPYPSRCDNERRRDQDNEQIEKFYEIFKDISFEISFTNALILMPKFSFTLKALIGNKEKLSEMARTSMNEHCSAVILNKLPRKLRDPGKFLIPCEFPGMDECLALADLGTSINLMPLSMWEGLLLPELTPTCMTLELADRSVSKLIGIAKDVSVKVGVNEAITYNLDQTSRYSANYNQMKANKIDVICEEYSQEVLGFSDTTASGNPTPHDDPIVSTTSPTLTPFRDSDFLLFEEADTFLGLEDYPNSPEFNPFYYDPKGDILLLEAILNSEPLPPLPNHGQYLPSFKNELKVCEAKTVKSFVDEPPEVELKDLPPHLEYTFLEGDNKLPVIIARELGDKEKSALIKVLKSHMRAIAWKLSDIQGINPKFYTHKILMEEDYKPAVQHQRRVNPKIHDIIKKEVEKLLDAGLIYPISDSPWVSPVHYVSIKGGFTVAENEENELIPTRLVTGWRVCIDYRKLNEATRKDHFPLPFMDQMLERLAGNEFYCFLDGFSGYFQIPIDPHDQEKTTFTCPCGTFAYRRMPFGLCNAPGTFQRCMLAIFHDMVKKTMEVFMDEFSVFGNSFENCLSRLDKMFQSDMCMAKKLSTFSKLATMDPRGDIMVLISLPKRSLMPVSSGPPFTRMSTSLSKTVNRANDKEKFHNMMRCLKTPSKFVKSLTFRALILWAHSRLHEGTNIFSWPSIICRNGLKRKHSPPMMPVLFANSLSLSSPDLAFRTAYKMPIGCTPYKLMYEKACHLPIELKHKAYWAMKQANFNLTVAGDHQKVQLNELNKLRDHAYENSLIYKEKTKRIHDSKIKNHVFNVGDRVLLFNSRLKIFSGKLKTRWSGPFTITKVFPYDTVELSQANGPNFKVNGRRVKNYFGGDVPQLVVPDLQTFPMDN
nr:reverse transcriptase domain-containing protein [Tanacetum cinerariifolium]